MPLRLTEDIPAEAPLPRPEERTADLPFSDPSEHEASHMTFAIGQTAGGDTLRRLLQELQQKKGGPNGS
jgi:hypothetical protein